MAWTRSALLRRDFAVFSAAIDALSLCKSTSKFWFEAALPRSRYVAAAAALTFAGIVLPDLDAATLSTALFAGGAAVAALALRPSLSPRSPASARCASGEPAAVRRFEELVRNPGRNTHLDREAWARLTAHMSHELRTPLNAVLGFSELMSKEVFGPMGASCYSDYARDIHASGRMLLKSAEDALAITALLTACPAKSKAASASLSSCISDALSFHASAICDGRLRLTTDFAADDQVLADAQTVRQVLINVLAELLDRSAPGAELSVVTRFATGELRCIIAIDGGADAGAHSFNLQLAHTLADLFGARIHQSEAGGVLQFAVSFTPSSQRDFFAQV